jgi:hypothetical protein
MDIQTYIYIIYNIIYKYIYIYPNHPKWIVPGIYCILAKWMVYNNGISMDDLEVFSFWETPIYLDIN